MNQIATVNFTGLTPSHQHEIRTILRICEQYGATVEFTNEQQLDPLQTQANTMDSSNNNSLESLDIQIIENSSEDDMPVYEHMLEHRLQHRLPIYTVAADLVHLQDLPPLIIENPPVVLLAQMLSYKTSRVRSTIKDLLVESKYISQSNGRTGSGIEVLVFLIFYNYLLIFVNI